jgi:hypothetical protein
VAGLKNEDILTILKTDLQISTTAYDAYFMNLINFSQAAITREGVSLEETTEDGMLVEMYAAYLYRKRRDENITMPRSLRYALNNRLISQKGRA